MYVLLLLLLLLLFPGETERCVTAQKPFVIYATALLSREFVSLSLSRMKRRHGQCFWMF